MSWYLKGLGEELHFRLSKTVCFWHDVLVVSIQAFEHNCDLKGVASAAPQLCILCMDSTHLKDLLAQTRL